MVRTAAAATEACFSAGVLRRREPLGVWERAWVTPEAWVDAAQAWGRPRRKAREGRERPPLEAAGAGLASPPQRTSEEEKGPSQLPVLSRDGHARVGKGLWACA